MKKVKRLFLFSCIFLFLFGNKLIAQDMIQKLERAISNLQPFTSEFVQEYYDAFQDKKEISKGKFYFMQFTHAFSGFIEYVF